MSTHASTAAAGGRLHDAVTLVPGIVLCGALATVATAVGQQVPVVGAPVLGVVLGVAISAWARRHPVLGPGIAFASRTVLQLAVVVLGAQLSLGQVAQAGVGSLPVLIGTLVICLLVAYIVGRALSIDLDLRTLIGVGTAICGASAIAAVSPVIRARSASVAYAISTIFCFNVIAVLVFPPLGHLLGLDQHAFALFAGTAVNDTSSVVAAATSYGPVAGHEAVAIKLTRSLMIIPICLVLAELTRRRGSGAAPAGVNPLLRAVRLVPWFLIGFLLVAAGNSIGLLPEGARPALQAVAVFGVTTALTGVGASTDTSAVRKAGLRPLLLGLVLWVVVATSSLGLQTLVG